MRLSPKPISTLLLSTLLLIAMVVSCARGPGDPGRAADGEQACAGLSESQVADTVATILRNVASVESKYEAVSYPKGSPPQRLVGAVVYVRAAPGLNAPWITRALICGARGHRPERCEAGDPCTLAVEGSEVATTEAGAGFAVTMRSANAETSREILRRARLISPAVSAP